MYELKDYLNSINFTKQDLMADGDVFWEKKYPAFIRSEEHTSELQSQD